MTIAEYIADRLQKKGVRYVFGIPGGPSIPYLEAFRSKGIEFILTSNEASAGIMADVTARLTGIPGICHATFGPGATNISTGVGGALLDRSPVIVFTSEMSDAMVNRTTQMNINHQKLFEPLTKASFRFNPNNVAEVMESAMRLCQDPYPGPVHIGLPSDISDIEIGNPEIAPSKKSSTIHYNNEVDELLKLLDKTRRPLLALGLTAARLGIQDKLLEFLEHYRMPVVITPMAKGLISEDHPCYAGVLFHSLSSYLEDIYDKTDLVIGLGYDPVEYNYESWVSGLPLIHFDVKETDLPSSGIVAQYYGPPDEWFSVLKNINKGLLVFEQAAIKGIRNEMLSVFDSLTDHFGPAAALKLLQNELPDDITLTADVGSHLHMIGQFWATHGKNKIIMSNGWSGMGFGIPAALAAQINNPSSTVVCITGDGGFLMMAGEMVTAKRYHLPVIVIVFSDGELNLIKTKQSWENIPPYGTTLYRGNLFGADIFLGIKVLTADSHESMKAAITAALSANEPVIINAIIDPDDYKWLIVKGRL